MTVDWTDFTPWASLAGGIMIGIAAAMFILLNGRIAGISGIVGGLLRPMRGDLHWRVAFLAGMFLAPLVFSLFAPLPTPRIDADVSLLVIAGMLVGAGTGYGSGCTSGHGVCGLSRLSPRSLLATALFMGSGIVTVFVSRHLFN